MEPECRASIQTVHVLLGQGRLVGFDEARVRNLKLDARPHALEVGAATVWTASVDAKAALLFHVRIPVAFRVDPVWNNMDRHCEVAEQVGVLPLADSDNPRDPPL